MYKNNNLIIAFGLTCSMFAACACSDDKSTNFEPGDNDPIIKVEGDVKVITTTNTRSSDLTISALDFSQKDNMSPRTIKLDPTTTYQEIDGFGAAITGATAYNLLKMDAEARTKFLTETFSVTEGFGMNYIRICIGCSDFSLSDYTCCDTPGIENFSLTDEENKYVIPILKEILKINPNVKIMGSPWTAPRWMKVNNLTDLKPIETWTNGQLNPAYYQDYATYFVKWIKAFEAEDIKIHAITIQNEPLNRGNSASMYMTWEEQRDFIKTALGPTFDKNGITAKIYAFDHNYNYDDVESQKSYPVRIYEDADAAKYLAGAAYHNYGGDKNELNNVHNAFPQKELIFTESTAGDWNDGSDLTTHLNGDMDEIVLGTVNRWCRGALIWNLMLDAERGPNRPGGCTTGFGAVDIDKNYKNITRNSFYYIMCHMTSVVSSGAKRIATSGYTDSDLTYTAFANPDGSYAFVISNSGSESHSITLDDGTHHFSATIASKSVISFKW